MHGCKTKICDVVWATSFIEQDIPICPAHSAAVEVVNHRAAVLFTKLPFSNPLCIERVDATLREYEVLFRKGLINQTDVVEHRIATAPRFIPVITDSPNKTRGLGISQKRADSLVNEIAIVIPRDDLLVSHTRAL